MGLRVNIDNLNSPDSAMNRNFERIKQALGNADRNFLRLLGIFGSDFMSRAIIRRDQEIVGGLIKQISLDFRTPWTGFIITRATLKSGTVSTIYAPQAQSNPSLLLELSMAGSGLDSVVVDLIIY